MEMSLIAARRLWSRRQRLLGTRSAQISFGVRRPFRAFLDPRFDQFQLGVGEAVGDGWHGRVAILVSGDRRYQGAMIWIAGNDDRRVSASG